MGNKEFNVGKSIDEASRRGEVDRELLVTQVEKAILSEARKYFRGREVEVQLDSFSGNLSLFQSLTVVSRPTSLLTEIPITDVRGEGLAAEVGDELLFRLFYRDTDETRAREQMKQFSQTPGLDFKTNNFEQIVLKTTQALLKKIKPQQKPTASIPRSTGVGKRVRKGAIFVDPSRKKRKIPLPKEIDILNRAAKTYEAGSTICREGEQSSALLLMMKGNIEVYQSDTKVNTIEGDIKFIGLLSYFTKGLRTATLKAQTQSKVVHIPETNIAHLFSQAPTLALRMLQDLSDLFLKRENELKGLQRTAAPDQKTESLARDFALLALSSVANSDPEIRCLAFNRVHQELSNRQLVPNSLHYDQQFLESAQLKEAEHSKVVLLQENVHQNKKNAAGETDARAHLLNQMTFDF